MSEGMTMSSMAGVRSQYVGLFLVVVVQ
ncbi:hypothetical protein A2U01_0061779, partial [Trifolium medium]|nr:hypothetical protein [Trifolium medium]